MVLKARETKRYEFEAVNSEQAFEIVHKIVPSMILGLLTVANFDECVQQSIVHTLPGAMNPFFFFWKGEFGSSWNLMLRDIHVDIASQLRRFKSYEHRRKPVRPCMRESFSIPWITAIQLELS